MSFSSEHERITVLFRHEHTEPVNQLSRLMYSSMCECVECVECVAKFQTQFSQNPRISQKICLLIMVVKTFMIITLLSDSVGFDELFLFFCLIIEIEKRLDDMFQYL